MFIDINVTVDKIATWQDALGVKLPKPLTDLLAVRDELAYVETSHEPVIDVSRVKPANVADEVEAVARELAVKAERFEARSRLLSALNRKILHAATAAVPDVIEQLTPVFGQAAHTYADAVAKLPEELSSDSLVVAGPDALAAFGAAVEAAKHLAAVDQWLAGLSQLPGYAAEAHPALRVCAPSDYQQMHTLLTAHNAAGTVDPLVREVGPVYLAAARAGAGFEILTPAESVELRRELEASKPESPAQKFLGIGRR
ncbi:hypothetical protein [Prescottella equi]|uniref:hypothetical protein n=1 Tax=Rhodococcus hoagii TaxID=43767 RepID=UPI001C74856C|nr:hypothetical protein [Prescottella equi]BCN45257.1 hypothetical protein RE9414_35370 [Prescottella equi]